MTSCLHCRMPLSACSSLLYDWMSERHPHRQDFFSEEKDSVSRNLPTNGIRNTEWFISRRNHETSVETRISHCSLQRKNLATRFWYSQIVPSWNKRKTFLSHYKPSLTSYTMRNAKKMKINPPIFPLKNQLYQSNTSFLFIKCLKKIRRKREVFRNLAFSKLVTWNLQKVKLRVFRFFERWLSRVMDGESDEG